MMMSKQHACIASGLLFVVASVMLVNNAMAQSPVATNPHISPTFVQDWENVPIKAMVSGITILLRAREMDTQCLLEIYRMDDDPVPGVVISIDDRATNPVLTPRLYSAKLSANSIDELVDQLQLQVSDFVWSYHPSYDIISIIDRDISANPDWALNREVNVDLDIESDAYAMISYEQRPVVRLQVGQSRTFVYQYISEISPRHSYWLASPLTRGAVMESSLGLPMPDVDAGEEEWNRWLDSRRRFYADREAYEFDLGHCMIVRRNAVLPSGNTSPHP